MVAKANKQYDLMADVLALVDEIRTAAKEKGLDRFLVREVMVRPHDGSTFTAANLFVQFKPNYGMVHELETLVTIPELAGDIETAEKRRDLGALFGRHMHYLVERAPLADQARRELMAAAARLSEEARAEGIRFELIDIEPTSTHVFREPGEGRRDFRQTFDLHLLMPHVDQGKETVDMFTIDANDAEEFESYVRERTFPELRQIKAKFADAAQT